VRPAENNRYDDVRRLLIYSQDGMGLGHLRRTSSIAHEILRREPDCSILILSDSPAAPPFDLTPGIDYVKLPTVVKIGDATWRSGTLPLAVEKTLRMRANLILESYRGFDPDTIFVDHMPVGARGELKPLLDSLPTGASRPKLFLGLRDILDDPRVIRDVWSDLGAYDYLGSYDCVLIFGCQDVYDADQAYCLGPFAQDVVFCHYALRTLPETPTRTAEDPFLLVMGGGGGEDAFVLEDTLLRALPELRANGFPRVVALTGPNMPGADRQALSAEAPPDVRIESGSRDATEWILPASAVLMMAGYNSMCEVVGARKKALVVPRRGPSREQQMRSRLFSERKLIATLDPHTLEPETLGAALLRLLREDGIPAADRVPPLDGIPRAAELMLAAPRRNGVSAAAAGRTKTPTRTRTTRR
jgi:predicted glycosyltransferase